MEMYDFSNGKSEDKDLKTTRYNQN